jgi:hypothetical protein
MGTLDWVLGGICAVALLVRLLNDGWKRTFLASGSEPEDRPAPLPSSEAVRRFWYAPGPSPLAIRLVSVASLIASAVLCAALGASGTLTLVVAVIVLALAQAAYVVVRGTKDIGR